MNVFLPLEADVNGATGAGALEKEAFQDQKHRIPAASIYIFGINTTRRDFASFSVDLADRRCSSGTRSRTSARTEATPSPWTTEGS